MLTSGTTGGTANHPLRASGDAFALRRRVLAGPFIGRIGLIPVHPEDNVHGAELGNMVRKLRLLLNNVESACERPVGFCKRLVPVCPLS